MRPNRAPAWALFSVGLTAIVGQILLMRELVAALYGNELLFGLILAAWLGWGAAGAALAAGRATGSGATYMAFGLGAVALLLPVQLALVRGLRTMLGAIPGSLLDLGPQILAVVLVLAPLCLCLGALFAIGTRLAVESNRTPGWAYVWDAIGSVVGGVLFSLVLVRWLNPFQTALLVAAANLAVALLLMRGDAPAARSEILVPPKNGPGQETHASVIVPHQSGQLEAAGARGSAHSRRIRPWSAILCVMLALLAFPLGAALQSATLRWQWPNLAFAGDSPYGRLTVQARGSQRIFYTDGLLAFETQGAFPEQVVHPPLLAHPAPDDVLLIGGGIAGDLREILKQPVDSVTYVELDPLLIRTARHYLPAAEAAPLEDPRVRLVLADGRAFVGQSDETFDAIILDLPEPTTGALNRFYTAEFFAQARRRLRPGGILAFGLPSAENYWNPELSRRNAVIDRTLGSVFPNVAVLPGEHDFFLASDGPLELDAAVMADRLLRRGVSTRWVTPAYLQDLLAGDRFAGAQARLEREAEDRINRDMNPLSYYYSLALWLTRSQGATWLRQGFEDAAAMRIWWLALPLGLFVILARWRRPWAVPLVVGGVGTAQMLLEIVLLFAFQALHGSLYGEVSLIVTAFMAGLALGGAMGNRLTKIAVRRLRIADLKHVALVGVLAGMAAYSALLPLAFTHSPRQGGGPELAFPALALVGGVLGGMVFPLASALRMADAPLPSGNRSAIRNPQSAIGGSLYAADLAGGCLGALLGTALLIPILGIPQTCAVVALLAVAGVIAIL